MTSLASPPLVLAGDCEDNLPARLGQVPDGRADQLLEVVGGELACELPRGRSGGVVDDG